MTELDFDALTWSASDLGDAVASIARHYGKDAGQIPRPPADLLFPSAVQRWMHGAATAVGLQAEPVSISLGVLESVLGNGECLLLPRRRGYLVLLRGGLLRPLLLAPGGRPVHVARHRLALELRREWAAKLSGANHAERLVSLLELPAECSPLVERVLSGRGSDAELSGCFVFRLAPGEPYHRQLLRLGLTRGLVGALVLGLLQAALGALSWLVFGVEALNGRLDSGRLSAWALVLLFTIPLQLAGSWLLGELAVRVGLSFKRRLFDGALRVSMDATRRDGVGGLLGRVHEAGAVEWLFIAGGLSALSIAADWLLAVVLLAQTAYPIASVVVFVLLTLMLAVMALDLMRKERAWLLARVRLAGSFTEQMLGHRTRATQEPRARWHEVEDRELESYFAASQRRDGRQVVQGALPRLLPAFGIALLVPLMMAPGIGLSALVLALVGVVTASSALDRLWALCGTAISATLAWRSAAVLFHASELDPATPQLYFQEAVAQTRAGGEALLEARDLTFRYPGRPRPVLSGCSLRIERGDRILVEGSSGKGKSTLGAILAGLRSPESGLLLVRGLDPNVLTPAQWRATVAAVPQFHENHVFTNTLAFNLLMGRAWPPSASDLQDAREICEELGLKPLIERMPGGLFEALGETGWQLSHGERSRVFIARALLQRADVTILDESFGSLDPDTLAAVIPCVLRRAGTLLVFAHA